MMSGSNNLIEGPTGCYRDAAAIEMSRTNGSAEIRTDLGIVVNFTGPRCVGCSRGWASIVPTHKDG